MKTRISTKVVGALMLIMTGTTAVSPAQEKAVSVRPSGPLRAFLRSYLESEGSGADKTTRITIVRVTTCSGKSEEDVVYITGDLWCGSGGCTLLILEPFDSSFRVVGDVSIVQLPIKLLASKTKGHPDIGVGVQGGGIQPGYEAIPSFDGNTYPGNPSVAPARKASAVRGKVIIASAQGSVPLYD
ncbi:MAG: hypothetical protein ACLP07_09990 [Terracidiphilus sp.]